MVAQITATAIKAYPVAKVVGRKGVQGVGFYTFWRVCEKGEDAVHNRFGDSTSRFKTRAQQLADLAAREQKEILAQSDSSTPKTPPGLSSTIDDFFSVSSLPEFGMLCVYAFILSAALAIVLVTNSNPTIKKGAKDFLAVCLLACVSWIITKSLTDYILQLDEGDIAAVQSAIEDPDIRFLLGASIAVVITLVVRRFSR